MQKVELLTVPEPVEVVQQHWFDGYMKALRQKTDTSLVTDSNHELAQRMRRTSSMPSVVDAMHKTSLERIRHYNYDLKLSKLQKRALRFTWHRLQTRNGGKRVDLVFEDVYDRLMRVVPIMKEMFTTRAFLSAMSKHEVATPRDHARFTVKMIDAVIKNLDTDDKKRTDTRSEYDPVLIGRAHAVLRPYGFVASIWEKLGETIIDVVLVQDAVRDLPGAGQAWVVLTACLVDQLRAGFEQNRDPKNRIPGRCPMHEMNKHSTVHPPHQVHPPHPFQTFSTPQTQRSASPILDLDQATEQLRQNSINRDRHSPPSEPVQRRAFSHQQSLPYPYMDEDVDENVESGNSLVLNRNEQMMLREQQKEDIRVAEALISGRYLDKQNEYRPRHHRSIAALFTNTPPPASQPITPHSNSPIHAPIASMDRSGSSSRCTSPGHPIPYRNRSPSHQHVIEMTSLTYRAISSGALPSSGRDDSPSKARRRSQPVESRYRKTKFY
ncbi:unnamed protein product [Bursaphelenchus okinawaensis]|uniref:Globin family profile domain-containing protein n=1 Tax=Bursaphelenchus okinawaensis TaxID=465554 RepID=A0A811LMT6_9BILA|nr:unnamed protein product [Bursaphelenchus okinawaensis]CAG9127249.1 unnamed protein product [Bursaphelenchus okinawaensis]